MFLNQKNSRVQEVHLDELVPYGVKLSIKREDELHPFISGNKYRKLAFNLEEARRLNKDTLLTFGGAYSNHIAAAAAAGAEFGFKTIGVIRGEELEGKLEQVLKENPTLRFAHTNKMQFHFVSRTAYRAKTEDRFIVQLQEQFGDFYLVPEGGTNALAVKGCESILDASDSEFDVISSSIGTGGTIAGLINSLKPGQRIIGFPSLKGDFLKKEIQKYVTTSDNWTLNTDYHFGGYGKISDTLIEFINSFKKATAIPLDPVYTGKMIFGLVDLIKKGYFEPGTKLLAIHTGGLQGIEGMNAVLKAKNKPLIH